MVGAVVRWLICVGASAAIAFIMAGVVAHALGKPEFAELAGTIAYFALVLSVLASFVEGNSLTRRHS